MCGGEVASVLKWMLDEKKMCGLDEMRLLKFADRHRLLLHPYLHDAIKRNYSREFLTQCLHKYFENMQRVFAVENFLDQLSDFLVQISGRAILLKGVSIASNYYENKYARHSRDIDVLVEEKNLIQVAEWLIQKGFQLESNYFDLTRKQQYVFLKINHHLCFYTKSGENQIIVELHWKLRSLDDVFQWDVFENTAWLLTTQHKNIYALQHVDQFIYLCVHGTEHGWYRMKWLLDLPMILNKVKMDWNDLIDRAKFLNAYEHVLFSLALLYRLTGYEFIDGCNENALKVISESRLISVIKRMQNDSFVELGYPAAIKQLLFLSSFNKRFFHSWFWMKWWVSPADWKRFPLPERLYFLYYPLRPFFWLIRKTIG